MTDIQIYVIPADTDKPMGLRTIDDEDLAGMQELVGGDLEVLSSRELLAITPKNLFEQGHYVAMVVNENANLMRTQPYNIRASILFPHASIRGDVFLILSGFHDFKSLPECFQQWDGPGHRLPKPVDWVQGV